MTHSATIIKEFLMHGTSLFDQYKAADWDRKAYIAENYETLKKAFDTYIRHFYRPAG